MDEDADQAKKAALEAKIAAKAEAAEASDYDSRRSRLMGRALRVSAYPRPE